MDLERIPMLRMQYSHPGSYDILNFQVGSDAENVIFKFTMAGPVENSWGSPNGLSVQTFDIYIDTDGDGEGGVALLPGRNLALEEGSAWDFAITVEGWEAGVFVPGDGGPERIAAASDLLIVADPGQQKVTVRVPMTILGANPETWRYAAMVLSQEGYPSRWCDAGPGCQCECRAMAHWRCTGRCYQPHPGDRPGVG